MQNEFKNLPTQNLLLKADQHLKQIKELKKPIVKILNDLKNQFDSKQAIELFDN